MSLHFKIKPDNILSMHKHSQIALFLSTFILILCTYKADVSWVDKQHFEKYSYCGQMATENPSVASTLENTSAEKIARGRIANSRPSTESYRWVVRTKTSILKMDGTFKEGSCSGTVITKR